MARIIIADDHALIREALSMRLSALGHEVVAEAEDGHQAIAAVAKTPCDLLMLDISMPEMDGFAAAKKIRLKQPALPILIVSTHDQQAYVAAGKELEVEGYLLKSACLDQMQRAIEALLKGETYFPELPENPAQSDGEELTEREVEILALVRAGLLSKQIAVRLSISTRTVEAHRRNLNRKLNL